MAIKYKITMNYDGLGYHILRLPKLKLFDFSVTKVSNSVLNSLFHTVHKIKPLYVLTL